MTDTDTLRPISEVYKAIEVAGTLPLKSVLHEPTGYAVLLDSLNTSLPNKVNGTPCFDPDEAEFISRWCNAYPDVMRLLKDILYHYENQDMNHVDFRVNVARNADALIEQLNEATTHLKGPHPMNNPSEKTLAELSAKASKGLLQFEEGSSYALPSGEYVQPCCINEDGETVFDEMYPADGRFVMALWNAYRAGALIPAEDGWREVDSSEIQALADTIPCDAQELKNSLAFFGGAIFARTRTPPNSDTLVSAERGWRSELNGILNGMDETSQRFLSRSGEDAWLDDHVRAGRVIAGFATAIRQVLKDADTPVSGRGEEGGGPCELPQLREIAKAARQLLNGASGHYINAEDRWCLETALDLYEGISHETIPERTKP